MNPIPPLPPLPEEDRSDLPPLTVTTLPPLPTQDSCTDTAAKAGSPVPSQLESLPPLPAALPESEEKAKPNWGKIVCILVGIGTGITALQFHQQTNVLDQQVQEEMKKSHALQTAIGEQMQIGKQLAKDQEDHMAATALVNATKQDITTLRNSINEFNENAATFQEIRRKIQTQERQFDENAKKLAQQPEGGDKIRTGITMPVPTVEKLADFVNQYIQARTDGNAQSLLNSFGKAVNYQYLKASPASQNAVLEDIFSGWKRWVSRTYRLLNIGVQGNHVEIIFYYDFRDARGKSASGYSKESWILDTQGKIIDWRETLNKKTPPPLSPGYTAIPVR